MKKFEDIDLVNYVINNGSTLKEAADFFGVSIDTIKKRMSSIKKDLKNDSIILTDINELANKNVLEGRKKGGKAPNSGISRNVDLETIAYQAVTMLANNLTIDEAAIRFAIAPSTLYEHLELLDCAEYEDIYSDLQMLYNYHKKFNYSKLVTDVEQRRCDHKTTWLSPIEHRVDIELEELQLKYSQKLDDMKQNKM